MRKTNAPPCQFFRSLLLIALGDSPAPLEEAYEYCIPLLDALDPDLPCAPHSRSHVRYAVKGWGRRGAGCVHSMYIRRLVMEQETRV